MRATVDGWYTFTSRSSFDAYGYLYNGSFDPFSPLINLRTFDDDSGNDRQFQIGHQLQSGHIYTLVITTYTPNDSGNFSITANGSAPVSMRLSVQNISKY